MPKVSAGLPDGVNRMLLDTQKYAESGVRPPIRTNVSSKVTSTLEYLRPSHLGKLNRLLFREKAKEKILHEKSANIGTPVGSATAFAADLGIKVAVGAATGLTSIASGGLSIALGSLYIGLKYLYDKDRKELERMKVEYYGLEKDQQKVMRSLSYLLANGELTSLAHKAEKAIVGQQKYAEARARFHLGNVTTKTCGDSVLLVWRYLYFQKRLFDSLHGAKSLAELLQFAGIAETSFQGVADGIAATGEALMKLWNRNSGQIRTSMRSSPLKNDGLLRWETWGGSRTSRFAGYIAAGRKESKSEKTLSQFNEILEKFASAGLDLSGKSARNVVYVFLKLGVAKATHALGKNGFSTAMLQSTSKPPPTIHIKGVSINAISGAALNLVITYAALWWNDKRNMKAFAGEDNGGNMTFAERIWLLRAILQHGRIKGLYKCYKNMTSALVDAHLMLQAIGTHNRTHEALVKIITQLYRAEAELAKGLALMFWVNRMIVEVTEAFTQMADYYEAELVELKNLLKRQHETTHSQCKGTCYDGFPGPKYPLS